jgi:DNA-binding winged helix-turn-helix (wHTH) protein/tetratricopeptide (TPR) repeat protein
MTIYRFGPFRLDREQLLLSLGDAPLALGPKVVETLLALIEHPGEVLSKSELLDRVWPEGFVEEANLAQNIYVIRKTLRTHWECEAIETVPRRGYRFIEHVELETSPVAHVAEPAPTHARRSYRRFAFAGGVAAVFALAIAVGIGGLARPTPATASAKALSPDGARLYAMGTFYWNQRTPDGVEKSLRYFKEVTQTDPHDARGYAGLASAYAIEGDYGFGPFSRREAFARALVYAKRALAVDAFSAEAHSALGLAEIDNMQAAKGENEFRRAIALNPDYAPAHQWYGMSLLREGKGAEAYDELRKATDLEPESVAATAWLSEAAYIARRYNDAIDYARQTLDLSPRRSDAYLSLGLAYEALGNYKAALAAYNSYASSCSSCRVASAPFFAHLYAVSHQYARAERLLRVAQAGVAKDRVDPGDMVAPLIAMGRRADALRILRAAKLEYRAFIAIDPRMDPVRHDARFREYVQGPA